MFSGKTTQILLELKSKHLYVEYLKICIQIGRQNSNYFQMFTEQTEKQTICFRCSERVKLNNEDEP